MTKELDRRFRHVGRIKRSWGTEHKPTIRLMEAMMTGLFERGRLDILRGIQSREYSPLQVWDAYRSNELEKLSTAATLAPLKESMEKWIAKKECSEAHRSGSPWKENQEDGVKRRPCVMWSDGPRVPGGRESCGRPATRGALAPPSADIALLPICDECVKNLNWPAELLRPLSK